MRVGIDISPLKSGNFLQHRVRGTGFYIENLRSALEKFCSKNSYTYFTKEEKVENLDLVHIPYFEPFFITLPKRKVFKTVVTVHDLTPLVFPQAFPSGIKGKLKWLVQKNRLAQSDAIITDSESSKKDIERFVSESVPVSVVNLAGNKYSKKKISEELKKKILSKYKLPEAFILYAGDATWNKNLPRLLDAAIQTNLPIAMVGSALANRDTDTSNPWNQDLISVWKKADQNKNIHLLGFVSDEDLEALYNLTSVFVMPSLYEGFGLPSLEAMSCGAACVTSTKGSIPEIGGKDGILYVDPTSAESIKEGILEVFNDKSLREA